MWQNLQCVPFLFLSYKMCPGHVLTSPPKKKKLCLSTVQWISMQSTPCKKAVCLQSYVPKPVQEIEGPLEGGCLRVSFDLWPRREQEGLSWPPWSVPCLPRTQKMKKEKSAALCFFHFNGHMCIIHSFTEHIHASGKRKTVTGPHLIKPCLIRQGVIRTFKDS